MEENNGRAAQFWRSHFFGRLLDTDQSVSQLLLDRTFPRLHAHPRVSRERWLVKIMGLRKIVSFWKIVFDWHPKQVHVAAQGSTQLHFSVTQGAEAAAAAADS